MAKDLLEQALQEIADDETLSATEKLKAQAAATKSYRSITGKAEMTIGRKDKTNVFGTFFRSAARTAGSSIVKSIFKAMR